MPKAYDQANTKLKSLCSSAKYVSLTFNGWTYQRLRAFSAVTMHYIYEVGQLKSHFFAFNSLSGKHVYFNSTIIKFLLFKGLNSIYFELENICSRSERKAYCEAAVKQVHFIFLIEKKLNFSFYVFRRS